MDGIILVNKPKGCTSHDVVYKVKKLFNEKVGHTGTLDPMATGILPLLIGKGTLCSKYLINHDKIYNVKLELGKKTITGDSEGEIIEEKEVDKNIFDDKYIKDIFEHCKGKQSQIPPIYSAIKVNGKKLYEYARKGQEVKIEPREIIIYDLELLGYDLDKKEIDFKVKCSKGTYIRSLCETIAEKMNSIGYMKELQRIQVGDFNIENTITIEELENLSSQKIQEIENNNYFITIENLFKEKEKIELNDKELKLFLNGVMLTKNLKEDIYKIYNNNFFIGLGIVQKQLLKRGVVIEN